MKELKACIGDRRLLYEAKRTGFLDRTVAALWDMTETEVYEMRKSSGILPVYKMIDTCASEFESYVPYFYSTYEEENRSVIEDRKKIVVLGSGPIRIGQGVEFDYSTVHAVKTIKEAGYEAIIINNNPETVSTDYTTSDKLYFEPLCVEDVMNVIEMEKPEGVIASLGGSSHQSGKAVGGKRRKADRYRLCGNRKSGEQRCLRETAVAAENPAAEGAGRNKY